METFGNAYNDAISLYALNMPRDKFDEIAMVAWEHIGNKIVRLHRFIAKTTPVGDGSHMIELPCNADPNLVESVNYLFEDERFVPYDPSLDWKGWVENYIERFKTFKHPMYNSGKFVKYEQVGDRLFFRHPCIVSILYKGVQVDEEGLPCITTKESFAIATYAAYRAAFRQQIITKVPDPNLPELKNEWEKACSSARVADYLNQNQNNEILDVLSSWNRKIYGKSFKPIR